MADDLLLELESTAPVTGSLESVEDLVRVIVREVAVAVEGMKGSALMFESAWQRMVANVAKGQTTEVQAARPRLLGAFDKRLGLLKRTHALIAWLVKLGGGENIRSWADHHTYATKFDHALAAWLAKLGWGDVPESNVLLPEIEGMESLRARVFDRWHSADDLEDLAARDYPLSTADLDQIGPQHRPPASYYAEESKPF